MTTMISCRLLGGWRERLRGLLWTDASRAGTVLLNPCRSIHTFGMPYAIDVAFLSKEGKVVLVKRGVPPKTVLTCRAACSVLERPASEASWPVEGEDISLVVRCSEPVEGESDYE